MDIVEYAENVIGLKLLDFQKYYLTRMYDIYKNDPDSFNKLTCWRGSANIDVITLLSIMFRLFDLLQQKGVLKNE